MTEVHRCK